MYEEQAKGVIKSILAVTVHAVTQVIRQPYDLNENDHCEMFFEQSLSIYTGAFS